MSKEQFQSVRGMRDLIAEDAEGFEYLTSVIKKQLAAYGYAPMHPPILEETALFSRSIGEGTDVVEKEMFTFDDHGESLTMRPEATAGMVRAVIQHGLTFGTHKLWTMGPMFRRERPQKGRYRQFHQFSVEAFGLETPETDAEQIMLLAELWEKLGIAHAVKLHINTLATAEVRQAYREKLVAYFNAHHDALDEDSKRRLHKNPLRILDSKNPAMQSLIEQAPKLLHHLDETSKAHFEQVLALLDAAGIAYVVDETLVRGLDYYNHTVYEWVTSELGAQGTICGGGRYDGLTAHIGGKSTPAVGFGLGIDRTLLLMQALNVVPAASATAVYFVTLGHAARAKALLLAQAVRAQLPNQSVLVHLSDNPLKAQMKKADKQAAIFAVIIGEDELNRDEAVVKHLQTGTQETVSLAALPTYFVKAFT